MTDKIEILDLFSAAAGGWSLGMHRAGFKTIAACEVIDWRRALYSENNPGVLVYDDVRNLTAERLVRDLGRLPSVIVGSPPCQDISSANTKGRGVEGERSGLYFEAIRLVGEIRPRWFAFENSSNLRTRGADAVLAALEGLGYACWPFVVRAGDIGANHERPRSWLIGCDVAQVTDADGLGRDEGWSRRRGRFDLPVSEDTGHTSQDRCGSRFSRGRAGAIAGAEQSPCGDAADANYQSFGRAEQPAAEGQGGDLPRSWPSSGDIGWKDGSRSIPRRYGGMGEAADADSHPIRVTELPGRPEPQAPVAGDNAFDPPRLGHEGGWSRRYGQDGDGTASVAEGDDAERPEMGLREADRLDALRSRADWSLDDLAGRVLLDARIQAWTFVAFLLDAGAQECLAERLIVEAKSAGFAARLSLGSDLQAALRTVLASYSESTVRRLAPIAETLLTDCNITLAPENSWEALARSAAETSASPFTTLTKTGPTTHQKTSKRSARRATQSTICAPDLKAVHRRAEQRFNRSASRLVEAFGDAVLPQIPEAIGRAMIRTERALAAIYGKTAA